MIELSVRPYKEVTLNDIEFVKEYGELAEKMLRNRARVSVNSFLQSYQKLSIRNKICDWLDGNITGFYRVIEDNEFSWEIIFMFENEGDPEALKIQFDGEKIDEKAL